MLQKQKQVIRPVGYTRDEIYAFGRNGSLLTIPVSQVKNPKVVPRFRPFRQSEMRGQLFREFRKGFEVSGTGNFLIVHPSGTRDLWAGRFEELYRSMIHFFRTRGFPVQKPEFPLVGVVFHDRNQYNQYCRAVLKSNASSSLGLYSPETNRLYLFDATQGTGRKSAEWEENLATVMHECAHQTAFNIGIHLRAAPTPRWLGEGLGCHFEARGVYNASQFKNLEDRLNVRRLLEFRRSVLSDAPQIISAIVASDTPFQMNAAQSYAAAWALTFYLSEREPRKYISYLRKVTQHEPLAEYGTGDRVREFASVFGKDYRMLGTRVARFIKGLPVPESLQAQRQVDPRSLVRLGASR